MSDTATAPVPRHRLAIFIASFLTLIAAGGGFAIRGGILGDWANQYGFTLTELGAITGGGFVGFGVVILFASLITDRVGYRAIMLLAFVCHIVSAIVTLAATPIYNAYGQQATFNCLYIGMFIFAVGNGLCEAAINPLVATLYPRKKTHYLNILHAGWPGGMILGAIAAKLFAGDAALITQLPWEIPMCFFLVPTAIYGFITIKEHFPISEARAAGMTFGKMIAQFASPLLLLLLMLQICVGFVELGTDSWITKITNEIVSGQGLYLFMWASAIMFVLRFFAGPIVEKINPFGLLLCSACIGALGLYLIGMSAGAPPDAAIVSVWAAVTIYGLGKSFYWPTMLGIVGEQFPRGGAITMGAVGGAGMLSAGLLGGPGIGYMQDYFASQRLQELSPPAYERYAAADPNQFLAFPEVKGLDGTKVAVVRDDSPDGPGTELAATVARLDKKGVENEDVAALSQWWNNVAADTATGDAKAVNEAMLYGGATALKYTALVPVFMAICYFFLLIGFHFKGGYKQVHIDGPEPVKQHEGEELTGGIPAPVR